MKFLKTLFLISALLTCGHVQAAILMTVLPSTGTGVINQAITENVVITNTGSTAFTITNLIPTAVYAISTSGGPLVGFAAPGGQSNAGVVWAQSAQTSRATSVFNVGPNATNLALAGTTTITVPYTVVFFAPSTGVTGSGTGAYLPGALVYLNDGSVNVPSQAGAVIVNPLPLPSTQQ